MFPITSHLCRVSALAVSEVDPRPSIPQALADCMGDRVVHVWQMRDPEGDVEPMEDAEDSVSLNQWLLLPTVLQSFIDKHFASYQLNMHNAEKMRAKKSITEAKYNKIVGDSVKPLLLMHSTGQPATAKYMSDHLFEDKEQGRMRLKVPFLLTQISKCCTFLT